MKTKIRFLFVRGERRRAKTERRVSTAAPCVSTHFQETPSFLEECGWRRSYFSSLAYTVLKTKLNWGFWFFLIGFLYYYRFSFLFQIGFLGIVLVECSIAKNRISPGFDYNNVTVLQLDPEWFLFFPGG